MNTRFHKILIANRGEIACRIMRTARRLGIRSVAVYSDADANALHVHLADEAFRIGPAPAAESYLNVPGVIDACLRSGSDAVHPGYGFLAENADFAESCEQAGVCFIGPPAAALRVMGSKHAALDLAADAGVPVLPGYRGADQSDAALAAAADDIGYPLLIKPVAGGGGKGMRSVDSPSELHQALASSRREARSSFADDRLLLEKFLLRPRHVELQIFADQHGNVVHLFDRDCSIQRRHQKIVEEAPAPGLTNKLRQHMADTAVKLAHAIDYRGAGTMEFLVDGSSKGDYFFMEMNTRLQVEHPVTEMILSADLVEWQVRIAQGEPLPADQGQLRTSGHAIETRIYAEDPERDFMPATGRLVRFRMPAVDDRLRVDTGVREGDDVGIHYDPMIAKLIVHGVDRDDAVQRLQLALDACRIAGLPTNLALLKRVAASDAFTNRKIDTGFVDSLGNLPTPSDDDEELGVAVACLYVLLEQAASSRRRGSDTKDPHSPWHTLPAWRSNAPGEDVVVLHVGEHDIRVPVRYEEDGFVLTLATGNVAARGRLLDDGELRATIGTRRLHVDVVRDGNELDVFFPGQHLRARCQDRDQPGVREDAGSGLLVAPMPGRVISVLVDRDANVEKGQALMIIEAMKMEHTIHAPVDGTVTAVSFAEGDLVEEGAELLAVVPAGGN
ncbi:MAG: acetyl/propionyl/methylcrotonyl-CoA carboxylase subunit alpha [Gammaproteobacteria bacterium]|nr:MAG: acetyl/propionyl/methylcrotonyl-CoA carboxylase subunit alpha [Gammaproteobacteria bacterium]